MSRIVWTLESALVFVRQMSSVLEHAGFGVALGGSVLQRGESQKDLDVVVFPLTSASFDWDDARTAFRDGLGMSLLFSEAVVKGRWQKLGSSDAKHVEVWETGDRSRVDIFFLK